MKKWILTSLSLLASFAVTPRLFAQLDAPGAGVAAAPAAPAKNLFSFFCLTPEQAARCKAKICNSPIGEMLKGMAKPLTMYSGGLLFAKCGVPTADDLAKLKAEGKLDSAEGAAAAIKKSEAEAKARREAVRYLGTVNCNYWPEARDALINGLRGDPNECVRYEAALALLRGCCCNKEVMIALKHSANASDKDGKPAEDSSRVRDAAAAALAHCTSIYVELAEVEKKKTEGIKEGIQQKEVIPNPGTTRGKGLVGIFANAAIPPAPGKSSGATFAAKESMTVVADKRGFASFQGKETHAPELMVPIAIETPVTPARYRPLPLTPAQRAAQTMPAGTLPAGTVPMEIRPAGAATPTRGIVIFDDNGAR